MPRRRPIALAAVGSAEVRASLDNLAGYCDLRRLRVVTILLARASRVRRSAACLQPVDGPLPYIADQVADTLLVWREGGHGGSALAVALGAVLVWECALPGVGHVTSVRRKFVTPGKFDAVKPVTRRVFMFSFRWQLLVGPGDIGEHVDEIRVDDRMIIETIDAALRPVRVAPVNAFEGRCDLSRSSTGDAGGWNTNKPA